MYGLSWFSFLSQLLRWGVYTSCFVKCTWGDASGRCNEVCLLCSVFPHGDYKGMLQEGARKCIVYLTTKEDVEEFYAIFTRVADQYFGIGPGLYCSAILAEDAKEDRADRLKKFSNATDFAVLLSIRILNEAIDLCACDSVFFASPCHSKITCVQRVCWSVRKDPSNPAKIAKVFVWSDVLEDTMDFVSSMKELDQDFSSKVQVISRRYCTASHHKVVQLATATADFVRFCIEVREYVRSSPGLARSPQQQAERYVAFVKQFGKHPSQQSNDSDERGCAIWAYNYRQALNGRNQCRVYAVVNAYLDAEVPGWNDLKVLAALKRAAELVEWVEASGRLPEHK